MDTLLSFYFVTGLIWSTYWTAHFAISGIQSLALQEASEMTVPSVQPTE